MKTSETEDPPSLLKEGDNCWRLNKAKHMGVLVEGEDYFKAVRASMREAQRRIMILAWEFHSQTELVRGEAEDGLPTEIGPFLDALLESNEALDIYILVWDYSLIYLQEREWKIFSDWLKHPHPRLHFIEDKSAPSGASHHQKIVSIDDYLAFCGGLDLSISRWDTREHKPMDERRVNPDGKQHDPYHDLHLVLEGPAAESLSELSRDRWAQATGECLEPVTVSGKKAGWPPGVPHTFEDVEVGITVISASPSNTPSQIEQLHFDLIGKAHTLIYIENQYFSSIALCKCLEERLQEEDGPEIVMLLPSETSGWLVDTVGLLRDRLLERLHEADRYDRFRVYAPMVSDKEGNRKGVYVHAKLLMVDDRILKIGSSNLSNRSMRVDSECDITLELPEIDERIRSFRQSLLAMHLGLKTGDWQEKEAASESLCEALDPHAEESRRHWLEPMDYGCDSEFKRQLADSQLLDPDDPIDPNYWVQRSVDEEERPFVLKHLITMVVSLVAAILVGVGVVWTWGEVVGKEEALQFFESLKDNSWSPLVVFAVFALGGILGIPLNFLLVTTAVVLGTQTAIFYGISGALVSSILGFYLGSLVGKPLLEKYGSHSFKRLNGKLGERSFRSVVVIRLLPVAPFFMVNLVAGASKLKFSQYLLGTLLGVTPGMCAVVLLANRAEALARRPSWDTALTFLLLLGGLIWLVLYMKKVLGGSSKKPSDDT